MTEPIDLNRHPAELPADLEPYFEAYGRATAQPDTAGLERRLEAAGYFHGGRALRRSRWMRVAGVLVVAGAAVWSLSRLQAAAPAYATVEGVSGEVVLARRGVVRLPRVPFSLVADDRLQAGSGGCQLELASGVRLCLAPLSQIRIRRVDHGGTVLDLGSGGVVVDAREGALEFVVADQRFYCEETSCEVRCCSNWSDPDAVLIEPQGRGLYRAAAPGTKSTDESVACTKGATIYSKVCGQILLEK